MRISDWSSDVCSSDLPTCDHRGRGHHPADPDFGQAAASAPGGAAIRRRLPIIAVARHSRINRSYRRQLRAIADGDEPCRSEEHTSELQSLMRISYAVFCLKKKTTT